MDYRDRILDFVKRSPVVPGHIAKELKTDTIMAGAMLAEMCDRKILKTSALRVGGSPLYYVPGTEALLLNFKGSLNEKDRRALDRLEKELIVRESEVDPLTRVSLQAIKDFSYPLIVEQNGVQERFFKWFLLKDEDAEPLIKKKLEPQVIVESGGLQSIQVPIPQPLPQPIAPQVPRVEPQRPHVAAQPKPKAEPKKVEAVVPAAPILAPSSESQSSLLPPDISVLQGEFGDKVRAFFDKTGVIVKECSMVKKKTEFDLIIELPSAFGRLPYYCKVRSKKKLTDADVSAAFVQGQLRKLPVLLVTDGELAKQATAVLEQLKAVTVTKV